MKNLLKLEGYIRQPKNTISLEKLTFLKQREQIERPVSRLTTQLNPQVIEHIKSYLSKEENRKLVENAFGNNQKTEGLRAFVLNYVSSREFLDSYKNKIDDYSLEHIADVLVEKIVGLDALQPLVEVETITDIKCFAFDNIWVDDIYEGKYKTDVKFESKQDYEELLSRFVFASNKQYSYSKPSVNAVFPFMRVNFVGQDLSSDITLSIRLISKELRYNEDDMIETGFATIEAIELLKKTFSTESHLVAGETGTGKTELLRYFAQYTQDDKEIVMIEDTPETYLAELYPNKAISMWQNRESSEDESKNFGYSYHCKNAMRQNIDYIFMQESRGSESYDILDASTSGHITNTTLHSESAIKTVSRFIYLCQRAQHHPDEYYGKMITDSFKIGVHVQRFGKVRKINEIAEYIGYENGKVQANLLVKYDPIKQKHEILNPLSKEIWDRLTVLHGEMPELQAFNPYNQIFRNRKEGVAI